MALLRVMHASDMPDPGQLVKKLEELASRTPAPVTVGPAGGEAAPAPVASLDLGDLVERLKRAGQLTLATKIELQVRVVALTEGSLTYAQADGFREDISADLRDGLYQLTGVRWQVERVPEGGVPTLIERQAAEREAGERRIRELPMVKAALEAFPGAELVEEEAGQGASRWAGRN
jgi:DNA polymerase-3 subunit gamma/tau